MILVIDNYDSFTFNLVQYIGEVRSDIQVIRNDVQTVEQLLALRPEKIIVSPGPCTPQEAGVSIELIQQAAKQSIPLLGVCLGHQSIGEAFGGKVIRAPYLMHGKVSQIYHDGGTLFTDIPSPFTATRYHSLIVEKQSLPSELQISAWTEDEIIMGLRHKSAPIEGIQFHPESILTTQGKKLLHNFVRA